MMPKKRQYHLNALPWSMNQKPMRSISYIIVKKIVLKEGVGKGGSESTRDGEEMDEHLVSY